ncbi:MAG: hypothetical protein Q4E22_05580 [Coriobacteriia bacterium]|nr:hypothetical protein [Coriobacteriia bacterium]
MLRQLTVFIENKNGRLAALCRTLSDHNINMSALMLADTDEFGIVRIICEDPQKAQDVLHKSGYSSAVNDVLGIQVSDEVGGLAEVLSIFEEASLAIEYAYCFSRESIDARSAVVVIKTGKDQNEYANQVLSDCKVRLLNQEDLQG